MPLYTVKCTHCGDQRDVFLRLADIDNTPLCHETPMEHVICAPMINCDITPYQAVGVDKATGKMPFITSRKEHREFLKRNNYHEVSVDSSPKREVRGDFDLKQDLIHATRQVLSK